MASSPTYRSVWARDDDQAEYLDDIQYSMPRPDVTAPQPSSLYRIARRPVPSQSNVAPTLLSPKYGRDVQKATQEYKSLSTVQETERSSECGATIRASKWSRLIADTWILEIIAGLISLAAIVSIAAVLWCYDNKPEPPLMKGITLNAVISFLATISRTSMMLCIGTTLSQGKWLWFTKNRSLIDLQTIENASRGPMGASVLVGKLIGGPILYIAGLLTILSLGYDTFVQQLLTTQALVVSQAASGVTIPAAFNFSVASDAMSFPETDLQIAAAMLANLQQFQPGGTQLFAEKRGELSGQITSSPLQAVCPSGNCLWNAYFALDVCSACRNTTAEMQFNSLTPEILADYQNNVTLINGGSLNSASAKLLWELQPKYGSSWVVPSGASMSGTWADIDGRPSDVQHILQVNTIVRKVTWPLNFDLGTTSQAVNWTRGSFAGITDPFAAIGFAEFDISGESPILNQSSECALTYCVKEFNRSVVQNNLITDILSVHFGNITVYEFTGVTYGNWLAVVNGSRYLEQVTDDLPPIISNLAMHLLGNATHSYDVSGVGGAHSLVTTSNSRDNEGEYKSASGDSFSWKGIDFTEDFAKVVSNTNGMLSDILQQYGNATITGADAVSKSFVRVRWPWITLPAAIVLLGLMAFGFIVLKTKKSRAPKWSSSLLPLLYRHIDIGEQHLRGQDGRSSPNPRAMTDGTNLISLFELEAEATHMRFEKARSEHKIWQLRSHEIVQAASGKKSWWK